MNNAQGSAERLAPPLPGGAGVHLHGRPDLSLEDGRRACDRRSAPTVTIPSGRRPPLPPGAPGLLPPLRRPPRRLAKRWTSRSRTSGAHDDAFFGRDAGVPKSPGARRARASLTTNAPAPPPLVTIATASGVTSTPGPIAGTPDRRPAPGPPTPPAAAPAPAGPAPRRRRLSVPRVLTGSPPQMPHEPTPTSS